MSSDSSHPEGDYGMAEDPSEHQAQQIPLAPTSQASGQPREWPFLIGMLAIVLIVLYLID